MITTSMLNSLNLERKTLSYYSIGAVLLIGCIYFLPKFIGVYALVLGLLLSYMVTAYFNLKLIKKTCKRPPKYKLFIIASAFFIIPSALFGYLLKGILSTFLPLYLTVIICSVLVTAFIYLLFNIFNLFSIKEVFSKWLILKIRKFYY